jgi:hypothetical protein
MKKVFFFFSVLMLFAAFAHAQVRISADVIFGRRQPNPTELSAMRAEEAGHPNIAKAMYDCKNALDALNAAPDNFGGHKAQAINDLRAAYISLRKALYFRLYHGG